MFGNALGSSVAEFGFKSIIHKLSPLVYKYPFQLPTDYLMIFRCFATLEGLALNVAPNFRLILKPEAQKLSQEIAIKWMRRMYDLIWN